MINKWSPVGSGYRKEIDGLRAIAVLAVIVSHSGLTFMPGGFAGVDIFFVLSGYLITGIVLRELQEGIFTFANFYQRRARRILPALFLVLITCFFVAFFRMTPTQFKDYALAQASTVIFLSNAYFWSLFGYFSPDATQQPLLHTWSLAVEEQFYLLFPVIVVLLWKVGGRRLVAPAIVLLAIASFLVCEWGWRNKPEANYYFSLSRFWEILAGSVCLIVERRRGAEVSDVLAGTGLALVVGSLLFLNERLPFPSMYTAVPILGTALVLLYGRAETQVAKILSVRFLVALGLISYSAYLWHQPVFSFARTEGLTWSEPGQALMLMGVTFSLAYMTWRCVESPFRHGGNQFQLSNRAAVFVAAVIATGLFASGVAEQYANTNLWLYANDDRPLLSVTRKEAKKYLHARTKSFEGKDFKEPGSRKILVVGDSFGKDLINALHEARAHEGLELSFHGIPAECGNLFVGLPRMGFPPEALTPSCNAIDRFEGKDLLDRIAAADVVVLASFWQEWQIPFLSTTLNNLQTVTGARLFVLGPKSFGLVPLKRLLEVPYADRHNMRIPADMAVVGRNLSIRLLGLDGFIDVQSLVCDGGVSCPVVDDAGYLLSEDGVHLTPAGAKRMGRLLVEHPFFLKGLQTDR